MKSILPDPDPKDTAFSSARKISGIAANVGFDWPTLEGILKKCVEEIGELKDAVNTKSGEEIFKEFGDILFALSNLGRHLGLDPEEALAESTRRFVQRFRLVEEQVKKSRRKWKDFTLEELDEMWEKAKKKEFLHTRIQISNESFDLAQGKQRAISNEKEKSNGKNPKSPVNKSKIKKNKNL